MNATTTPTKDHTFCHTCHVMIGRINPWLYRTVYVATDGTDRCILHDDRPRAERVRRPL